MKSLLTPFLTSLLLVAPAHAETPEGFEAIFNGKDLAGWEGNSQYWSVVDGVLTGKADGTLKSNQFLIFQSEPIKNFELQVKVRISEGGNSGLQYRSVVVPNGEEKAMKGSQCDIVAKNHNYNGMLYEERGRRILARTGETVVIDELARPWIVDKTEVKKFAPAEWHDYRILVQGNHIQHWIDGHSTADVIDCDEEGRILAGLLGVQVHVGPPMTVEFKDFHLKRLADDLPMQKPEIPDDAILVKPQGKLPKGWTAPMRKDVLAEEEAAAKSEE